MRPAGERRPPVVAGIVLTVAVSLLGTAEGGPAAASDPTPTTSAGTSSAPYTPPDSDTLSGTSTDRRVGPESFDVELPQGLAWRRTGSRRTTGGGWIEGWRAVDISPGPSTSPSPRAGATPRAAAGPTASAGPPCAVTLGQLKDFHGSFPATALTTFAARDDPVVRVIRNAPLVPLPAGTIAAVEQEQQFATPGAAGTLVVGHLYVRSALTRGRTLVTVTVAVVDDAVPRCRAPEILGSLQLHDPNGQP